MTGKTQELQRRRGWRDGRQAGGRTCCSFLRLSLSDPASLRRRTNRPSQLASPWERPERVVDKQSAAAAIFSTPNIPKVPPRTVETAGGGGEWGRGGGGILCWQFGCSGLASSPRTPRRKKHTWEMHLIGWAFLCFCVGFFLLAGLQSKMLLTN